MQSSVYTNRAIKATDDLIAFYKDKISELEKFKEDLETGKIQGGEYDDFGKYYVNTRPRDDKRIVFWSKNPDKPYEGSDVFSIRYDDHKCGEPVGICDAVVLDFAFIIDRIRSERDDPDIFYGESDEDGNLRYKDEVYAERAADSSVSETDSECD